MPKAIESYIIKVAEGKEGRDGVPSIGPTYKSIYSKDLPPAPANIQTCWDMFRESVKQFPDNPLLGTRKIVDGKAGEYEFDTYREVLEKVLPIGSAMRAVGVKPEGRCGIYGANSPEWYMAMQACNAHSIYCVPLYDTLGEDAVEFILKHAEVSIVFVQEVKLPLLLNSLAKGDHGVKSVVSFTTFSDEQKTTIHQKCSGVTAYSLEDFTNHGILNPFEITPPKKEDICTIMYTSGTTGEPKGVLISHASVVDIIIATKHILNCWNIPVDQNEAYLSYLPLAHIFDRVGEEMLTFLGGRIGYWQGNALVLMDDMKALQPTMFIGVPRIFDRIHSGFHKKINDAGWLTKAIFNYGYRTKLNNMWSGYTQEWASPLFDRIVFNKVKQSMGGKVRIVISGAAPLADHVEEFLRTALCTPVVQGYGLTESCCGTFLAVPNVMSMKGTVGPPMPNIEARLVSVPEMNYDALGMPERGEICLKGTAVCSGYYKNEAITNDSIIDGWFHTGDIGEWQPNGALKIIDRKKNIFKLSQGEYVAVEKLENIYSLTTIVDTIWVYGNSFESSLVAIVVPTPGELESWAKSAGIEGDFKTICTLPKAREYVVKQLSATQKSNKLKGFEAIRAVHLESEPFSFENDLITPTFKKKRPQLLKHYQSVVDELYKSMKTK
ncbi:unnamed protein product [Calypogeia fissa]